MKGVISFYGKTNCKGNLKQKEILSDHGYRIQEIDILRKQWDRESLLKFFNILPITQCINYKAPLITGGELIIENYTDEQILDLMIENPILIKRPLLFFRGEYGVGFDNELVTKLIGEKQTEIKCSKKICT